ncbi:hypothetical protein [Sorangium sp. So ce1182]|uniref:hypothetical protein n=1 Tax=Sorangium sp. So ce1182 TaxID=3133334 RepID=UPI003F642DF5
MTPRRRACSGRAIEGEPVGKGAGNGAAKPTAEPAALRTRNAAAQAELDQRDGAGARGRPGPTEAGAPSSGVRRASASAGRPGIPVTPPPRRC